MKERPTAQQSLLLFDHQRALETVQAIPGLTPARLWKVLFPLWEVECVGIQRRSRPYEMLELFLERGIAEGHLRSVAELAGFFGLDNALVEKMLLFLRAIGHVDGTNDELRLTNLAQNSLADEKIYYEMETRRKLYFEAYTSHPLPQEHYRLDILSEAEAMFHPDRHAFRLFSFRAWQPDALMALAQRPDHAHWNLPDEVRDLKEEAVTRAYLPMYIVEARERLRGNHVGARYVVLTRLRDLRDSFFEKLVNAESDVMDLLYAEAVPDVRQLMENHLADRGIDLRDINLSQLAPDAWRATIAERTFLSTEKSITLKDVGRYQLVRGYCLQIWCDDPALRREAALDQAIHVISNWQRPATQQTVMQLLETLITRLQTIKLDIDELKRHASTQGKTAVLAKLEAIEVTG